MNLRQYLVRELNARRLHVTDWKAVEALFSSIPRDEWGAFVHEAQRRALARHIKQATRRYKRAPEFKEIYSYRVLNRDFESAMKERDDSRIRQAGRDPRSQ